MEELRYDVLKMNIWNLPYLVYEKIYLWKPLNIFFASHSTLSLVASMNGMIHYLTIGIHLERVGLWRFKDDYLKVTFTLRNQVVSYISHLEKLEHYSSKDQVASHNTFLVVLKNSTADRSKGSNSVISDAP